MLAALGKAEFHFSLDVFFSERKKRIKCWKLWLKKKVRENWEPNDGKDPQSPGFSAVHLNKRVLPVNVDT